ncbi:hypothetical protein Hdeb2414_s0002g00052201 [Helianthus debilis subsp. tardiflorus]
MESNEVYLIGCIYGCQAVRDWINFVYLVFDITSLSTMGDGAIYSCLLG